MDSEVDAIKMYFPLNVGVTAVLARGVIKLKRKRNSIPAKRKLTFLSEHPNRHLIPPKILFSVHLGVYHLCYSGQSVIWATHVHLISKVRMNGSTQALRLFLFSDA